MSDEKEVFSCHTGLALADSYFCQTQSMRAEDLLPAFSQLNAMCDGMITAPGLYAIKLQIVKLK